MLNPILGELAHEQCKDRLREAEQYRLANAVMACQPADRFDLRTSLDNLLITVRYLFKAPTCAD
ncbi:MAG: hypothetical protein ACJ8CR_24915 [Roseiflexaceae bacterium]